MTQLDPHKASVSAETLALLRRLRIQYRERPAIYRDLVRLSAIALGTANGTELAIENTPKPGSILTTQEAADLSGLQARTIRRALEERRLDGTKHGREWQISRRALLEWMARRAA